jgi:alpha-tubulin suppressor-like RCC1 family protein
VATPGLVSALSHVRVVEVSAGGLHSIAVTGKGALYTWGAGRDGKLGHGDIASRPLPVCVAALRGVRISRVSAGDSHSLAVAADGSLYSFGLGESGRLGHGDEKSVHVPRRVQGLRGAKVLAIAAGTYHSIALIQPRPRRHAGANAAPDEAQFQLPSPMPAGTPAGSWGVESEPVVVTFGDGAYGKLGHGNVVDQLLPRIVESLRGQHVCEVAAGYQHSAVRADPAHGARVLTAGIGWKGQLGSADLRSGAEVLGMDPDFYHTCVFRPAADR